MWIFLLCLYNKGLGLSLGLGVAEVTGWGYGRLMEGETHIECLRQCNSLSLPDKTFYSCLILISSSKISRSFSVAVFKPVCRKNVHKQLQHHNFVSFHWGSLAQWTQQCHRSHFILLINRTNKTNQLMQWLRCGISRFIEFSSAWI